MARGFQVGGLVLRREGRARDPVRENLQGLEMPVLKEDTWRESSEQRLKM